MPAFSGTSGLPSLDVMSIQGTATMTPVKTDSSGVTQPISASALPLPELASTAAKQDTGNVSLASIDGKLTTGIVAAVPAASTGGASAVNRISQATMNAVNVKSTAGTLYSLNATNRHASNYCYVKLYNKATAPSPSGGADFPAQILCVPPGRKEELVLPPCGLNFSVGISYVIVGGYADNDETAVVLGDVILSGTYK